MEAGWQGTRWLRGGSSWPPATPPLRASRPPAPQGLPNSSPPHGLLPPHPSGPSAAPMPLKAPHCHGPSESFSSFHPPVPSGSPPSLAELPRSSTALKELHRSQLIWRLGPPSIAASNTRAGNTWRFMAGILYSQVGLKDSALREELSPGQGEARSHPAFPARPGGPSTRSSRDEL